jgi:hypothetical protein
MRAIKAKTFSGQGGLLVRPERLALVPDAIECRPIKKRKQ